MDIQHRTQRGCWSQFFRTVGCFSIAVVALIGLCGGIYYVLYKNPPASDVCRVAHEELNTGANIYQPQTPTFVAQRILVRYFTGRNTWGLPGGWDVAARNTNGSISVAVTNPLRVDPLDWSSTIHVCDSQGQQIYGLRLPTNGIDDITISPNEKFVAWRSSTGIYVLEVDKQHIEQITTQMIRRIVLSSDGLLNRP